MICCLLGQIFMLLSISGKIELNSFKKGRQHLIPGFHLHPCFWSFLLEQDKGLCSRPTPALADSITGVRFSDLLQYGWHRANYDRRCGSRLLRVVVNHVGDGEVSQSEVWNQRKIRNLVFPLKNVAPFFLEAGKQSHCRNLYSIYTS